VAVVMTTFALGLWLIPMTGSGGPLALFFAALLVIVYLTFLLQKGRQAAHDSNRQLRGANDEITKSMARTKESEERLNLALESAQVGMWDLDLLTDTSVRSLRHDQIFGYSSPVPTWGAATFMTHVVPEDRDDAKRAFDTAFATGHFDIECRIQWADTSIHWISARGRAYRNATGDPVRMMGTLMDITERKRADEALKAANASLDAIIDNIPLMLFIKDSTSLRFLRFNRAGEDLLGSPRHTFLGKSDYDFWPPEQARFFVEKDRETLNSGKIVDIPEEPIQTPHQGVRILHTKKVPILDGAGNPIYLLGISEDITERKRIEKDQQFLAEASVVLSASLDYERTLANLARLVVERVADWCGVDVRDEHGQLRRLKVASADPAGAALCAVLEQMPPDRGLPHVLRTVIESKQPVVNEHVTPEYLESIAQGPAHLQALQAMGLTSLIVVPLLLRGQALGAMALGSSTPSRVYLQDDLRLAEALADRAAIAIENARLYRASVEAAQLRDQVLSVVAHDLRNPLSTILLLAGALRRLDPEAEEAIRGAATRMDRLIQDLLDVALMESSQLTLEPVRMSTRELIVGAVETQRPLASSSSLELRVDLDGDVPNVWGDRDRLLQVFQNLIGNAIKFTDAGGRITVSVASTDHEVVFQVADTGCGIAPEDLPRVFDRFWQATRAGSQGAGLGLQITKGIVETHGGRIWVESSEGRGTTVSFTIPTVAQRE
jgi:PAS domain S-box-containing protein